LGQNRKQSLFTMHNASRAQTFWKLRLPHAVPSVFVGLRISSGISVIGGITGELFAGSSRVGEGGIGYSIMYASTQLQTDYLFALVFVAARTTTVGKSATPLRKLPNKASRARFHLN
jgi:ABC-type nitrate/sulfonate/bicarbonate transport system permease component